MYHDDFGFDALPLQSPLDRSPRGSSLWVQEQDYASQLVGLLLASDLFSARTPGPHPVLEGALLATSWPGVVVRFTGESLDQDDLDTLLGCLLLAFGNPGRSSGSTRFPLRDLARRIGAKGRRPTVRGLERSLWRLAGAGLGVTSEDGKIRTHTRLIHDSHGNLPPRNHGVSDAESCKRPHRRGLFLFTPYAIPNIQRPRLFFSPEPADKSRSFSVTCHLHHGHVHDPTRCVKRPESSGSGGPTDLDRIGRRLSEGDRSHRPVIARVAFRHEGVFMAQGVGLALSEDFEDIKKHSSLAGAGVPYIKDIPDKMELIYIESPREHGPFGATGCGEVSLCGPHSAIINAIANGTGVVIRHLPAYPEKVLAGLKALGK